MIAYDHPLRAGSVATNWSLRRLAMCMLLLSGCVLLSGCGQQKIDGPPRFVLSGTVTYDGKPIPKGFITIEPDSEKGNTGPGSGAPITNGKFSTPSETGHVGGPHRVRIVGYDGVPTTEEGEELADGKPLFPTYETTVDLPKANGEQDFTVPKQ